MVCVALPSLRLSSTTPVFPFFAAATWVWMSSLSYLDISLVRLIYRDLMQGTFSLRSFYERRAKRILPALLTVVSVFTFWAPCY